jgi:hypothetical protein
MSAVQEWVAQCRVADTSLVAQSPTVVGMGSPRELVEQCRGVIPRRVVARPCCVRVLNARTRVREQARRSPRARRTPLEGGVSPRARRTPLERGVNPRARRTSLEGALCCATLVGRGAVVVWIVLRVCVRLEVGLRFAFLQVLSRIPPPRLFRIEVGLARPTGTTTRRRGQGGLMRSHNHNLNQGGVRWSKVGALGPLGTAPRARYL